MTEEVTRRRGGGLPVEQPTDFDLAKNLEAAEALRLALPPTSLVQAKEGIQ